MAGPGEAVGLETIEAGWQVKIDKYAATGRGHVVEEVEA